MRNSYKALNISISKDEARDLYDAWIAGDQNAYAALYFRAWCIMEALSERYGSSEFTYKFYERIPKILAEFNPNRGGLYGFMWRRYASFASKRRAFEAKYGAVAVDPCVLKDLNACAETPEEDRSDVYARMWQCMLDIDPSVRRFLIDKHIHGLTNKQCGEKYGCSTSWVSYACIHALRKLRIKMAAER